MASRRVRRGNRNSLPKLPRIDKIVNNYLDKLYDAPLKDRDRVPGVAKFFKNFHVGPTP